MTNSSDNPLPGDAPETKKNSIDDYGSVDFGGASSLSPSPKLDSQPLQGDELLSSLETSPVESVQNEQTDRQDGIPSPTSSPLEDAPTFAATPALQQPKEEPLLDPPSGLDAYGKGSAFPTDPTDSLVSPLAPEKLSPSGLSSPQEPALESLGAPSSGEPPTTAKPKSAESLSESKKTSEFEINAPSTEIAAPPAWEPPVTEEIPTYQAEISQPKWEPPAAPEIAESKIPAAPDIQFQDDAGDEMVFGEVVSAEIVEEEEPVEAAFAEEADIEPLNFYASDPQPSPLANLYGLQSSTATAPRRASPASPSASVLRAKEKANKVFGMGVGSIALSVAGLLTCCCSGGFFFVEIAAFIMGSMAYSSGTTDLLAMRRGQLDPVGRATTQMGVQLGAVGAGMALLLGIGYAVILALGITTDI